MRVSREKAAENRERIIDAAGVLFRAKGFDGIGVADIMKAADLTHGGFYGHFASKDDLAAQASRRAHGALGRQVGARCRGFAQGAVRGAARELPLAAHRDDPGRGCAFAALGSDAARSGKAVRAAFAEGLEPLPRHSCRSYSRGARRRRGGARPSPPWRHWSAPSTLARAVGDQRFSDEILEAVHRELLEAVDR